MNLRHITRFTYTYTYFQGWRVAINRQGTNLARYFSDKQYGSEDAARDEAIRFRDMLLDEINQNPLRTREILDKYRVLGQKPSLTLNSSGHIVNGVPQEEMTHHHRRDIQGAGDKTALPSLLQHIAEHKEKAQQRDNDIDVDNHITHRHSGFEIREKQAMQGQVSTNSQKRAQFSPHLALTGT